MNHSGTVFNARVYGRILMATLMLMQASIDNDDEDV